MDPDDFDSMPPFPFPRELFPKDTFPAGMKTTREILTGLPPSVLELIETGRSDELVPINTAPWSKVQPPLLFCARPLVLQGSMYEKAYSQLGMGSDSDEDDVSDETRQRREQHRRAKQRAKATFGGMFGGGGMGAGGMGDGAMVNNP